MSIDVHAQKSLLRMRRSQIEFSSEILGRAARIDISEAFSVVPACWPGTFRTNDVPKVGIIELTV